MMHTSSIRIKFLAIQSTISHKEAVVDCRYQPQMLSEKTKSKNGKSTRIQKQSFKLLKFGCDALNESIDTCDTLEKHLNSTYSTKNEN